MANILSDSRGTSPGGVQSAKMAHCPSQRRTPCLFFSSEKAPFHRWKRCKNPLKHNAMIISTIYISVRNTRSLEWMKWTARELDETTKPVLFLILVQTPAFQKSTRQLLFLRLENCAGELLPILGYYQWVVRLSILKLENCAGELLPILAYYQWVVGLSISKLENCAGEFLPILG